MRTKEIEKFFRERITSVMATRLPDYRRLNPGKIHGSNLIFRHQHKSSFVFVVFQFSDRDSDSFTVEFGWSPDQDWRYDIPLSIPVDLPESQIVKAAPEAGRYRFRISFLWPPHRDIWWVLTPEPSLEEIMDWFEDMEVQPTSQLSSDEILRAESLIEDAIEKLLNVVLPFWQKHL